MDIQFKGTNYEPTAELLERMTKKLGSVERYLGSEADAAQMFVELAKDTNHHQTGDIWRAEMNITVTGTFYRATAVRDTMENAIDSAIAEVKKEIERGRKKGHSLTKRGGNMLKSLMRGFR